jgi:predicted transposase/invertase (TIGR01784 family)
MSRQEIEVMFNVQSLRNTRVFQEGIEEGVEKNKLKMIPKLVAAGLSLEKIAEITSLPLDQVREWLHLYNTLQSKVPKNLPKFMTRRCANAF